MADIGGGEIDKNDAAYGRLTQRLPLVAVGGGVDYLQNLSDQEIDVLRKDIALSRKSTLVNSLKILVKSGTEREKEDATKALEGIETMREFIAYNTLLSVAKEVGNSGKIMLWLEKNNKDPKYIVDVWKYASKSSVYNMRLTLSGKISFFGVPKDRRSLENSDNWDRLVRIVAICQDRVEPNTIKDKIQEEVAPANSVDNTSLFDAEHDFLINERILDAIQSNGKIPGGYDIGKLAVCFMNATLSQYFEPYLSASSGPNNTNFKLFQKLGDQITSNSNSINPEERKTTATYMAAIMESEWYKNILSGSEKEAGHTSTLLQGRKEWLVNWFDTLRQEVSPSERAKASQQGKGVGLFGRFRKN